MLSTKFVKALAVVSLLTSSAAADTCVKATFIETNQGKDVETTTSTCFESDEEVYQSEDCFKKAKCDALIEMKKQFPIQRERYRALPGSPAGQLCQILGGDLEVVRVRKESEWKDSDRCVFKDGSFVSGAKLYKANKTAP